jgi:uncharacterized protein (DUF2237 family)
MTGALAGAHLGEQAIPPRWLARLERVDKLCELADRFAARILAGTAPGVILPSRQGRLRGSST